MGERCWQSVVTRQACEKVPTFHRPLAAVYKTGDMLDPEATEKHSRWATACGLLMEEIRWVERRTAKGYEQVEFLRERNEWTWMRRDNAEAIGRFCGRCFPAPAPLGGKEGERT